VLDEQRVHGDPEALVHPLPERRLGLLGSPGPNDAEPVRDAMHVRIDRYRGDPVAEDEHAVRGLRPDTTDRHELLEGSRYGAVETVEDIASARPDHARLHVVEPGPSNERFDLGGRRAGERDRVREPGEQPGARRVRVRIAGALGEDCPDEDLERVFGVVAQIRPTPIPRAVKRAQAVEEPLPIERGGRGTLHPGPLRGEGADEVAVAGPVTPGSERSGSSGSPSARRSSPTR
jgi:hypothetical protein